MTGREDLPDRMVRMLDKMGSVTDKPWRSPPGQFPGGQSQGLNTESWRVNEISIIFDT